MVTQIVSIVYVCVVFEKCGSVKVTLQWGIKLDKRPINVIVTENVKTIYLRLNYKPPVSKSIR